MRNKDPYKFIDVNNESEGDVAYCPTCQKGGYPRQKLYELDTDPDNFCICEHGHKFPVYERKDEGQWSFPFAHTDNPFDSGSQFEKVGKRKYHDRLKDYRENEEDN